MKLNQEQEQKIGVETIQRNMNMSKEVLTPLKQGLKWKKLRQMHQLDTRKS